MYNLAKSNVTKIIDPIHNKGFRLSIDAFRTNPVNSTLCIAGKPSLQVRRNKEILKYIQHHITFRILTSDTRPNKPSQHKKIIDTYKILSDNFTFYIEPLSPFIIVPSWKRHLNINTQLLLFNKNSKIQRNCKYRISSLYPNIHRRVRKFQWRGIRLHNKYIIQTI
jgi:hypothetical protein